MPVNECASCGMAFNSFRRDRRWCTPECKRELKRKYDRERYPTISVETNTRACAWQRDNRDRKQAYDAFYRANMTPEQRAAKREYDRNHPGDPLAAGLAASKRRARKRANGAFLVTPKDLRRALSRARDECTYCKARLTPKNLEWDHIIPIARFGTHSIGNLTPACHDCNGTKSHRLVMEWRIGKVVPRSSISMSTIV